MAGSTQDRRAAAAALRRLDRETIAQSRRGRGPHHDRPSGRPSVGSIRRGSSLALIALIASAILLVGWGMMRFVMWFGTFLGSQILPVPAARFAHSVIGLLIELLATR